MSREYYPGNRSAHDLMVYASGLFRCVQGVNAGDALDSVDEICLGDIYRIAAASDGERMVLRGPDPKAGMALPSHAYQRVADGHDIRADLCLTVMTDCGVMGRLRVLQSDAGCWLLPLGALDIFAPQTVISVDPIAAPLPLADPTCLAFARGTRMTLQDGSLKAIEDMACGDLVLTRDGRGAAVLGVLRDSVPTTGRNTRIVIREGAFANESELVVSAAHRLFVPARRNQFAPNGADRMEPAFKLVNGLTITAEAGGTSEYFHILLNTHEIIYAEGIPCESFLLDVTARAGLTESLAAQIATLAPRLRHAPNPLSLAPADRPQPDAVSAARAKA